MVASSLLLFVSPLSVCGFSYSVQKLNAITMARTKTVLEGPHAFLTRLGFVISREYDYYKGEFVKGNS